MYVFQCTVDMRKLKFKLVRNVIPLYGTSYTTCIGCDTVFKEMLNIKDDAISQSGRVNSTSQNNTRNTSSFTSTSSTSQSQSARRQVTVPTIVRSGENDSDVELIEIPSPSRRHAQNHSNTWSNNPNNVNRSTTISDNRRSLDFWSNMVDFNNSENRSDQSRNAANTNDRTNTWGNVDSNAEIMCKCHETAIQLTVRKEGPNKGKWNIFH